MRVPSPCRSHLNCGFRAGHVGQRIQPFFDHGVNRQIEVDESTGNMYQRLQLWHDTRHLEDLFSTEEATRKVSTE